MAALRGFRGLVEAGGSRGSDADMAEASVAGIAASTCAACSAYMPARLGEGA